MIDMLDEFRNINPTKKDLRKFGIIFGIILSFILSFSFYKQKFDTYLFFGFPILFIFFGIFLPNVLNSFFKIWMSFAIVMQWIITHVILTLLFYLIITPIGILSRLFRKDFLSLQFRTGTNTYWSKRGEKKKTIQDYERQF